MKKPHQHPKQECAEQQRKATSIKLGLDIHADSVCVVRQIDGASPQPAQKFTWAKFWPWAAKQCQLVERVYSCYEAGPFGYVTHRHLTQLGIENIVVRPQNWDDLGSAIELEAFIGDAIEPGAMVCTDDWSGYRGLAAKGCYEHHPISMRASAAHGELALPRVHLVFSLLQRWLLSTHQGAVRSSHLDYYLDEFTFRFNRRTSASRGKLFYRLIEQALEIEPSPYRTLLGENPSDHN